MYLDSRVKVKINLAACAARKTLCYDDLRFAYRCLGVLIFKSF